MNLSIENIAMENMWLIVVEKNINGINICNCDRKINNGKKTLFIGNMKVIQY